MASTERVAFKVPADLLPMRTFVNAAWGVRQLAKAIADTAPECEFSGLKTYGCAHCNGVEPDFDLMEVLP